MSGILAAAVLAFFAAPERLTMIPVIVGGPSEISPSLVASAISQVTSRRRGLELMSLEERFARGDSARTASVLACGRDTACIAKKLASEDAKLCLVVIVNEEIDPPLLAMIFVGAKEIVAESYEEIAPGADALRRAIVARAGKTLDDLGYRESARINVGVRPALATVELDRGVDPDAGTSSVFTVEAGKHELVVRLPGYREERREIVAAAGETVAIEIELAEETSALDSPWLWAGAIAVAATAAGIAAFVLIGSDSTCICASSVDETSCSRCD